MDDRTTFLTVNHVLSGVLGGLGLLLLGALVSRARSYGRLLSDAHFLSIASGAARLRRAACARVINAEADAIADANDPRVLSTELGLAIVYTVTRRQAEFTHHCSVSFPGQHVAQSSLELFLHFVVRVLEFPTQQTRVEPGVGAVRHAECVLSADEHADLEARAPLDLSASNLLAWRSEAMNARLERRA